MKKKTSILIRVLFATALALFMILGIVTVLLQLIGLLSGNGELMVFADSKIFPFAVLGSTVAGFLSFVFPYAADKEKNTHHEEK